METLWFLTRWEASEATVAPPRTRATLLRIELREVERIAHIPPKGGKENRILQNLSELVPVPALWTYSWYAWKWQGLRSRLLLPVGFYGFLLAPTVHAESLKVGLLPSSLFRCAKNYGELSFDVFVPASEPGQTPSHSTTTNGRHSWTLCCRLLGQKTGNGTRASRTNDENL